LPDSQWEVALLREQVQLAGLARLALKEVVGQESVAVV